MYEGVWVWEPWSLAENEWNIEYSINKAMGYTNMGCEYEKNLQEKSTICRPLEVMEENHNKPNDEEEEGKDYEMKDNYMMCKAIEDSKSFKSGFR